MFLEPASVLPDPVRHVPRLALFVFLQGAEGFFFLTIEVAVVVAVVGGEGTGSSGGDFQVP
ncbi:MAG: hypothetical protein ACO4CZ_18230 [Planctomycetota bacterium]